MTECNFNENELADKLFYKRKNVWEEVSVGEKEKILSFAGEYKNFLSFAKTERKTVRAAREILETFGFRPLGEGVIIAPGSRFYWEVKKKALVAAVIGQAPLEEGLNLVAAHIDSPRLDLKPYPVYEEEGLALLKTHYYGGIKKYQWLSTPLALHGVVVKKDGSVVDITVGEEPGDPVFAIPDLLPHLAREQMEKKISEAVLGEGLNVLASSIPLKTTGVSGVIKEVVKHALLNTLYFRYGITEEDLASAELQFVPAGPARDVGFDNSLVGGYGQDDRACAYAALRAIAGIAGNKRTAVLVLADKEETGSYGNTGLESCILLNFLSRLAVLPGSGSGELSIYRLLENSFALSADVNVGLDPNFLDVVEKGNTARLGFGVVITKYTGSRGKHLTNDAHAETVARLRWLLDMDNVIWQTGELGKVDQGGGGTVAHLLARYGMDVLDCGIALLGMHSPFEVASKADIYMAYKAYSAFFKADGWC